ncbi:DUF192 domain-containing protein [Roseivivax sediminis]|uniref:DUF192 domain-containing protein n=1 Tax=Roseivivax sediminis TaxID=936889 RepID=A0A1I1X6J1_9RHOB|nr:DUF192 domain-containing protein [Roseivivax sediminis]SFE03025.1 hypothetical protein SAMN04515678_105260 [Roseivivax sediminis]
MGIRGIADAVGPGLALAILPVLAAAECREDRVSIRGDFGNVSFRAEVADTNEERAQGLMHVEEMGRLEGMLFVYDRPQSVAFWMKNTLIPLDMIFADARGVVQKVHDRAQPHDLTGIPGGDDIQYVLEVNGGMAETLGIAPGAEMRHPSIAEGAWPCEESDSAG